MSHNYAYPPERPLSKGQFDFCPGPGGRWAAWIASEGIRYGLWTGYILDDTNGTPNPLFVLNERPSKLSICFDSNSQPIIAIQRDGQNVEIRWIVPSNIENRTADMTAITADDTTPLGQQFDTKALIFAGQSAVISNNSEGVNNPTQTQVVCYYLKPDGTTIFARFLADNFGIEYIINASLTPLSRLIKTETQQIAGDWYQLLWAETTDGRQVFFKSQIFPIIAEDAISLDGSFGPGSYFVPIIPPDITEGVTMDSTLSGAYVLTVIPSTVTDSLTADGTVSGAYVATTLPKTAPSDNLNAGSTLGPGSYA